MSASIAISFLCAACSSASSQLSSAAPSAAPTPAGPQPAEVRTGNSVVLRMPTSGSGAASLDDEAIRSMLADAFARAGLDGGAAWSDLPPSSAVAMDKGASFLGVATEPISEQTAAQLPVARGTGLAVTLVEPESPAAKAGIQPLDVVTRLGDQLLVNPEQLAVLIRSRSPGDSVELTFLRGGKEQRVTVALGARDQPKLAPGGRRPMAVLGGAWNLDGALGDDIGAAIAGSIAGSSPAGMPGIMSFGGPGTRVIGPMSTSGAANGMIIFRDDAAEVSSRSGVGTAYFRVKDLADGSTWEGTRPPNDEELASMRPEVAASVRRFLKEQPAIRDALPAGKALPNPRP